MGTLKCEMCQLNDPVVTTPASRGAQEPELCSSVHDVDHTGSGSTLGSAVD